MLVKDCEIKLSSMKREPRSAAGTTTQPANQVTLKADMVKLICQDAKIGQRPQ